MVVNPSLYSVWLYYHGGVGAVVEKSQSIFQRTLSDEEYVKLIDARTGEIVRISPSRFEQSPGSFIPTIRIKLVRTIQIDTWSGTVEVEYALSSDGSKAELTLLNFQVPQVAQGKSLGTRMFAAQVEAAHAFGFDHIVAYAAGGKVDPAPQKSRLAQYLLDSGASIREENDDQNGYYTWPRLGFDTHLTSKEQDRLPRELAGLTYLSDLLELPEGRAWWRENGFAIELTFDTSPQSRSMRTLQDALDRLTQKGKCWEIVPDDMSLRVERGATLRPRRDWRGRIWVYRRN